HGHNLYMLPVDHVTITRVAAFMVVVASYGMAPYPYMGYYICNMILGRSI
ncbi:unnamed protein product, partial [Didymodactylos carnosus]